MTHSGERDRENFHKLIWIWVVSLIIIIHSSMSMFFLSLARPSSFSRCVPSALHDSEDWSPPVALEYMFVCFVWHSYRWNRQIH